MFDEVRYWLGDDVRIVNRVQKISSKYGSDSASKTLSRVDEEIRLYRESEVDMDLEPVYAHLTDIASIDEEDARSVETQEEAYELIKEEFGDVESYFDGEEYLIDVQEEALTTAAGVPAEIDEETEYTSVGNYICVKGMKGVFAFIGGLGKVGVKKDRWQLDKLREEFEEYREKELE